MEQLKNHPEKQNNTRVMFMVFNTTFNNFQLYRGGKFYWWKKPEYGRRKPSTCRTRLTNLYMVHLAGIELTTLLVIDADYRDSCKSSFHANMNTTALTNTSEA